MSEEAKKQLINEIEKDFNTNRYSFLTNLKARLDNYEISEAKQPPPRFGAEFYKDSAFVYDRYQDNARVSRFLNGHPDPEGSAKA